MGFSSKTKTTSFSCYKGDKMNNLLKNIAVDFPKAFDIIDWNFFRLRTLRNLEISRRSQTS